MGPIKAVGSAAAALALLCCSCGQYPNVHQRAVVEARRSPTPGPAGSAPSPSPVPSVSQTPLSTPSLDGASGLGSGGFTTSPAQGLPTATPSSENGPGSKSVAGTTPAGSRAAGATIVIGVHASITGAAPGREDSVETEKGLYWRHGNSGGPVSIFGRAVRMVVEDDRSDPSQAQQACQDLVTERHVFLLLGLSGADEISACAHYARSAGVPYVSVGAPRRPLAGLGQYFAVSETYSQQAAPLAGYIKKTYTRRCRSVLMIAEDTANVDDAVTAFRQACPGVDVLRVPVSDRGEPYGAELCAGRASAYRAVYPLTSATFFLQMASAARSCAPRYVGVGITLGLDAVAASFCRQGGRSNHMRFLSPAPAFADSDRFDRAFRRAASREGVTANDVGWLLWGLDATLDRLLHRAGTHLTRRGFVRAVEGAEVNVDGWTRLRFSASDHFGGRSFSLLTNVCSGGGGHFETLKAGVSGL